LWKEWMEVIAKAQPGLRQYGKGDVHFGRVIEMVAEAQPGLYQHEKGWRVG